ncbi:hypothetical protein [Nostoc sp. 'Peltigera membranacea cyanobiont' 213]|nr:hypothetical protein [Nostoc sp. 'Peltigera membranacea cyanobiont' 213]
MKVQRGSNAIDPVVLRSLQAGGGYAIAVPDKDSGVKCNNFPKIF